MSTAFLFRKNRRHPRGRGRDGQTDGRDATLNAACWEGSHNEHTRWSSKTGWGKCMFSATRPAALPL